MTGRFRCAAAAVLAWAALGAVAASADPPPADRPTGLLDTYGNWRRFVMFRPLVVAAAAEQPADPKLKSAEQRTREGIESHFVGYQYEHLGMSAKVKMFTPAPPADWQAADFDDATWWRAPGPQYPGFGDEGPSYGRPDGTHHAALLCLRGRFTVADPAAVTSLALTAAYRGGILVTLNGTEVARGHLPAGLVEANTLAVKYPADCYVDAEGKALAPIGIETFLGRSKYRRTETIAAYEKNKARYEGRIRHLDATVPVNLLRKGVNVLAVEVHRAPHDPVLLGGRFDYKSRPNTWLTAGLNEVKLTAAGAGAPAASGGLQVVNAPVARGLFNADFATGVEPSRAIRAVAPRNGAFWGQALVCANGPIRGLAAELSDLAGPGGATIPASACQVRYPQATAVEQGAWTRYPLKDVRRFDALAEAAPKEVAVATWTSADGRAWPAQAVQPIWIQGKAPADAPAGDYAGTLTIRADGGGPLAVAVRVRVAPFALPDPREFDSVVDFVQSPDWAVWRYKVPRWSDRHWALIARTFDLLGTIGNKTLYVPLICKTHLDHEQSMVRWVRKADGSYDHDYSAMEKYLDLAQKHMPSLREVCLIVFDRHMLAQADRNSASAGPPVTVIDATSGELSEARLPAYGDPAAKALWKPVAEGVRDRLKARGLGGGMAIGLVNDYGLPDQATCDFWADLLPEAGWVAMGHGISVQFTKARKAKQAYGVGHGGGAATDADSFRYGRDAYPLGCYYGWDRARPWDPGRKLFAEHSRGGRDLLTMLSGRDFLSAHRPLCNDRLAVEFNIQGNQAGVGFQPADFWSNESYGMVNPRFTHWGNNNMCSNKLAPGPDGPLDTVRFELMRQGVQEAEARIVVEKALLDVTRRRKLDDLLIKRCEELIADRTRTLLWALYSRGWYCTVDWDAYAERLFDTAAQVQEKLRSAD